MSQILKTPAAAQALGRTKSQLLRLIDHGHLLPGVHYFRGAHRNSPITWDVGACQQRFAELAKMPVPEHGDPIKSNASSGVNEKPSFLELAKELRWQRAAVMLLAKKVGEDPGELFKAAAILLNGEAEID